MDKEIFLQFAESLKLVRRARVEDFIKDKNVDDIYTDLLPSNAIINKLNLPRTTLLVGRKGTGKSTIFQKSQKDLIENKKCISLYIDVKSLYDNSTPTISDEIPKFSSDETHKYLLYSHLIKLIVLETKAKLDAFVKQSILQKILGFEYEKIQEIEDVLSNIEESIIDVIKKVNISLVTSYKNTQEQKDGEEFSCNVEISKNPSLSVGSKETSNGFLKKEFESKLITYLDIRACLIDNLMRIKDTLQIDHLYIFLDDYSEINEEAQRIFMDWFIAPLNNLSADFVKFKIAIYPHRFYYGKLDNSKIDEISLDFFDAYYTFEKKVDISKMELLALDYTDRLITKRFNLFFSFQKWDTFFSISKGELVDLLFSVSFNNPRKIGYILSYCYESCLIHGVKISRDAVENAALRYYNDVVLKYFIANNFVTKPFNDKISNEHQFELLSKIIERQKLNISTAYRTRMKGKPGNHFIINTNLNHLLSNLELNGFLSTYNCTKDKNDELSTIYSLDFGLCKRHNINFNRAYTEKLINYFALPRFNMNILVLDYFNKTQVIKCSQGHEFPYKMHSTLKSYNMKCPTCLENDIITRCEVVISNEEIKDRLRLIENKNIQKTTFDEFILLDYLRMINKSVTISKISNSLDRSELSVKILLSKLQERDLVKEDIEVSRALRKDHYMISNTGASFVDRINNIIENKIQEQKITI